jgi:hypothetical protein
MSLTEYLQLIHLLLKVINITNEYGGKRDMLIDVTTEMLVDMRKIWGDLAGKESVNDIPF